MYRRRIDDVGSDDVDVDCTNPVDELTHHRLRCDRALARCSGLAWNSTDHQLCRLLDAGEGGERFGHVVADDLSVDPAEPDEQTALMLQVGSRHAVVTDHVYPDQLRAGAPGESRGAAHQVIAALPSEGHDHTLAHAVCVVSDSGEQLSLEVLFDAISEPQQAELS